MILGVGIPGSKFKNTELVLLCEWKECSFVGKCMEEFCNHIAEHLEEYLQHPLETAGQLCLICQRDYIAAWKIIPSLENKIAFTLPALQMFIAFLRPSCMKPLDKGLYLLFTSYLIVLFFCLY